jgi:threonine aldolase
MRQAGYLAAAGLFALQHHVLRLRDDHMKAKALESELSSLPYVADVLPVETNIVIFTLRDPLGTEAFLQQLRRQNILALSMGGRTIRIVFHLDISAAQFDALLEALRRIKIAN